MEVHVEMIYQVLTRNGVFFWIYSFGLPLVFAWAIFDGLCEHIIMRYRTKIVLNFIWAMTSMIILFWSFTSGYQEYLPKRDWEGMLYAVCTLCWILQFALSGYMTASCYWRAQKNRAYRAILN